MTPIHASELMDGETHALSLDRLQEYEMIVFDGGNSAGDAWKHVFFPRQMREFFVSEDIIPY